MQGPLSDARGLGEPTIHEKGATCAGIVSLSSEDLYLGFSVLGILMVSVGSTCSRYRLLMSSLLHCALLLM